MSDDWTQEQLQEHAFQKMLAAPAMSDDVDVKALIAEARAVVRDAGSYNFVPEPRLILELAAALEAVSARPLVADEQRVLNELLTGDYYRAADQGDSAMLVGAVLEAARNAGALVADREAVRNAIASIPMIWDVQGIVIDYLIDHDDADHITDALFASGVIQSKGDAQAEALEEAAEEIALGPYSEWERHGNGNVVLDGEAQASVWLCARAAAHRTPASPNSEEDGHHG
jgi:hypothetical protein